MLIENENAVKLVELLKGSKKLNQKKTTVSFNADGTRCSVSLSWNRKNKKDMCCADGSTVFMLGTMLAWSMAGEI